ncbi:hypothetical protein LJY25_15675 [Hymenobacter sp. BT175]|uniref:hypothetical protein n=1 Tax=Hymenobacter translucens TaxID=2886507 RepID=UPI001D0E7869|nr:hypothetical protein [Hymenobacter translucens]MCC2547889.1 hypothetical protein [Hymenobacter translucens]
MLISLTRDSVAMGDDCLAPHTRHLTVADGTGLLEILQLVHSTRYLASISGGMATWVAILGKPVAVLAQQWAEPVLLSDATAFQQLKQDELQLHFRYYAQRDPVEVLDELRQITQWLNPG